MEFVANQVEILEFLENSVEVLAASTTLLMHSKENLVAFSENFKGFSKKPQTNGSTDEYL
jgi:hypothetical protein